MPDGKWGFSRVYEDVNVAIATGHSHDFGELPEDIRASLIARFRVRGTMEAYEDELAKEKSKQDAGRRGMGPSRRRR